VNIFCNGFVTFVSHLYNFTKGYINEPWRVKKRSKEEANNLSNTLCSEKWTPK